MPKIYNITDWNQQTWVSTGGTRSKKYVQDPASGKFYYFKKSLKKPGYEYFFEFWNEVIATELGLALGFNMLRYDIAIDGDYMGCISESMISTDGEELVEGGKYMQAYEMDFTPEVKDARQLYSFQLITETLEAFNLDHYINEIIELLVFDALISNGDRHQENWAFINKISFTSGAVKMIEDAVITGRFETAPKWLQRIIRFFYNFYLDFDKKAVKPEAQAVRLYLNEVKGFAPIYDSGSSLARELSEQKVEALLSDEHRFDAYVDRGTSEIHWGDEKINHFDMIATLLTSSYAEITAKTLERVITRFNEGDLVKMVMEVDNEVPENLKIFKLSQARKRLIIKLITSRLEILKSLFDERV